MDLKTVIIETLGMMGFTFLIGMGVAYVIKMLVELFHFFRKGNVSTVMQDYKAKLALEQMRRKKVKKAFNTLGSSTDVDMLKYIYENKNKFDTQEEVDEMYNLFNFYRGMYKDKKESEGINDLIKYYNGEV